MLLERIGYDHVTVHGFRSIFKDWARDRARFDNYVVEAALAHASGDKVEAAYARSDVLAKRRKLMEAWQEFCASKPAAATKTKTSWRCVPRDVLIFREARGRPTGRAEHSHRRSALLRAPSKGGAAVTQCSTTFVAINSISANIRGSASLRRQFI